MHCHISEEVNTPMLNLPPINDRRVQAVFWSTFAFYTITYFYGNIDTTETFLTLLGTFFSISGVWLTALVALWAIEVEQRKKKHEEEENKYYKIHLIHDLYGLIMQIKIAYHWDSYYPATEDERQKMEEKISKDIKQSEATIFGWCSDLQMLNLNPHAPPDIKSQVSLIIRTAQKTNLFNVGVVEDVFRRIRNLLNTPYVKDIKDGSVLQWIENIKRNIDLEAKNQ